MKGRVEHVAQRLRPCCSASLLLSMLLLLSAAFSATAQTVEYIHTDALGTPVAITNAAGQVIERSEYEPYGALLNRPLSDGPGFTGHVQDAATGLTYMQQRYYDPVIGVFLSVDPVTAYNNPVSAFNRYWYANNSPYRFIDPDGRLVRDSLEKITRQQGSQCQSNPSCRFAFADNSGSEGKKRIEKAWRGIAAHKIIQADIATSLPGVEVKAERRSLNPFSGKFGRVDLMLRRSENSPWSVFEIKPGTQQSSASMRQAAILQLNRYVHSLNAEGEQAEVGNWSDFFPREQNRAITTPPLKIGGVDFGGSYIYGPDDTGNGVIYYSAGSPTIL